MRYTGKKRAHCLLTYSPEVQHVEEHLVLFGIYPSLNINEKETERDRKKNFREK